VYPGRAEVFIVYGINLVFKGIWAAVRPFLDTKTQGSTHLLNSKAELLEFIAEDQLADFMGGANVYTHKSLAEDEEEHRRVVGAGGGEETRQAVAAAEA
jgi:hypothetical protein